MSKRETISPLEFGPFGDGDPRSVETDVQATVQIASVSQV